MSSEKSETVNDSPVPVGVKTRMDAGHFSLVTTPSADGEVFTAPDCEGTTGDIRLLRPRPAETISHQTRTETRQKSTFTTHHGTRMVDNDQMLRMFNESSELHSKHNPDCRVPKFAIQDEKKWGLGWKCTLTCTLCEFVAPEFKLFKELQSARPGPNPAAINLMFQSGLQDTPIGNTSARLIIASADIPPPAKSSMQKTANKVGAATVTLNDADMTDKLELIKKTNEDRGAAEPSHIRVGMDVRYSSSTTVSRNKPGQSASQAFGLACENVTKNQYIIGTSVQNKLCWKGAYFKAQGVDIDCPGGHPDCTANLDTVEPLSEYDIGKNIGTQLVRKNIKVKYATTDGDGRSAAGMDSAMKVSDPAWNVERLADPTHLGQAQFHRCNKLGTFSETMFLARTKAERVTAQRVFSQDIKARSSLVFQELMSQYKGDVDKIKLVLPKVLEATVRCYNGDCSMCRRHSLVCAGGDSHNWWLRSMFLGANKITGFNMNSADLTEVTEILKMKLGEHGLMKMKFNSNTQKCEAANRGASVSLPKNVNYSRNMEPRLASCVHRLNNGVGYSLRQKANNLGTEFSTQVHSALEQMQKVSKYHKTYQKRDDVKKRNAIKRGHAIYEHVTHKTQVSDYRKGQLDNVPTSAAIKRRRGDDSCKDHVYSKV
jgi:hypothetical protein